MFYAESISQTKQIKITFIQLLMLLISISTLVSFFTPGFHAHYSFFEFIHDMPAGLMEIDFVAGSSIQSQSLVLSRLNILTNILKMLGYTSLFFIVLTGIFTLTGCSRASVFILAILSTLSTSLVLIFLYYLP